MAVSSFVLALPSCFESFADANVELPAPLSIAVLQAQMHADVLTQHLALAIPCRDLEVIRLCITPPIRAAGM